MFELSARDRQAMIAFLQEMIRIPSYSTQEAEMAARLSAEMNKVGFQDVHIDRIGNVVGRIGPGTGRTLLYNGHMDVVGIGDASTWEHGPFAADIQDGVLYALDGWTVKEDDAPLSLRVLDLSNAAQPTEILSMPIPDYQPLSPSEVIAQGDWLYMILGNQGLKLFDISEPRAPVEVSVTIEGIPFLSAQTMAVDGDVMIINGSIVLDISDPTTPTFIGMAFERMEPWTCDIVGDRVYVATRFHGIWVYELDRGD